jgi:hypothetical protein
MTSSTKIHYNIKECPEKVPLSMTSESVDPFLFSSGAEICLKEWGQLTSQRMI